MSVLDRVFFCALIVSLCLMTSSTAMALAHPPLIHITPTAIDDEQKASEPVLNRVAAALWERAVEYSTSNNAKAAEEVLLELVRSTPDFYPSADTPPKIMAPFHRARKKFLKEEKARPHIKARVVSDSVHDGMVRINLEVNDELKALLTKVIVHIKTRSQSAFRLFKIRAPFADGHMIDVNFTYPMSSDDHLDYYVDFVGTFNEPFFSIGSATLPRYLMSKKIIDTPKNIAADETTLSQFKAGWPIVVSVAIAVAGAVTYGLLKL